jgi:hypothetical protein
VNAEASRGNARAATDLIDTLNRDEFGADKLVSSCAVTLRACHTGRPPRISCVSTLDSKRQNREYLFGAAANGLVPTGEVSAAHVWHTRDEELLKRSEKCDARIVIGVHVHVCATRKTAVNCD